MGLTLMDEMDGIYLLAQLDGANESIETFISTKMDEAIFQRQGNQENNIIMGYNEAFVELVAAYDALDDANTRRANRALFGDSATSDKADLYQTTLYMSVPDAKTVFVSRCPNPDNSCYGYYEDANEHKRNCKQKHGVDGEIDVGYWACHSDKCSHSDEHWVSCRGKRGSVLFPPPTNDKLFSLMNILVYHDHEVECQEPIYSIWNGLFGYQAKCFKMYFTCEGGCEHRASEGVFYNKTGFSVYETLAVRVIRDELYMAIMQMDDVMVDTAYGVDGELTLRKSFDSDDAGNSTVKIIVWFGDVNSPSSSKHEASISVD